MSIPLSSAASIDPSRAGMEAISRKYAALPAEQRRRFRQQASRQGLDMGRLPIVALTGDPANGRCFPLSPAQEQLWAAWKLDADNPAYHLSRAVRCSGKLDVAVLRQALRALVERHESLRLCFIATEDGGSYQAAHAEPIYAWRESQLEGDLRERLRILAREPFDLAAGPLLRAELLWTGRDLAVLLLSTHHIIADGWSLELLWRDLFTLYQAVREGRDPAQALPPLSLQFGDVVAWRREWQAQETNGHLDYWISKLATEHAALELPLDRPRPAVRGIEGGHQRLAIGAALTVALRRLASSLRTPLSTVLLGTFGILLQRYGGQCRLRIGMPVAGRQQRELEGVIGYFINTLVIAIELDGAQEIAAVLRALHRQVSEAQAHQEVSFAQVMRALRLAGEEGLAAPFQVMFNLEQAGTRSVEVLTDLILQPVDGSTDTARFDLVLNAIDDGDTLKFSFNYAKDVFDASTVARLAAHYEELLRQLAAGTAERVGALQLSGGVPAAPAHRYPFQSLAQTLSLQAGRTPQAVAVRCEGASLSYGELESWSNQVAGQLLAGGVQAEQRVGLCMVRGPALIAALLGILKSGAALVPLDPEYPAARLAQMRADAGLVRVLVDAPSLARQGAVLSGCALLAVAAPPSAAVALPAVSVHPQQLAYVLYTSGSTGVPKGVAVSHEALWTHLEDFQRTYRLDAADTVLHSSTINFDVALHEILPALRVGARIEMRGAAAWDLASLSERLVAGQVSFARIPTALWQAWQREAPARRSLALRQVTVGGEALPGDALARWQSGPLGDIRLDNLYGPTETTIAALYRATVAGDGEAVTVPIGRPYAGRTARVVDAYGEESPVGGVGELCIGGVTVARGYLGRAGQTAERFVPDPWGEAGSRLYRSGDLCRQRGDGTVDYLGREDGQVKLRGQRIELGEIESVLRGCAGVGEAVVVMREEGGQPRLAGYVTGTAEEGALRRQLESRLPAYMVPPTLTVLASLPRMANGKLDRAALPLPAAGVERVAPRDEREASLLGIWRQVLGREALGVTDNFFEVGGDSILSLQIVARAREAGLRLTPRQVFEQPSVARLAAVAESVAEVVAREEPASEALALTPIQRWFFERYPVGESHWNQSVLLQTQALDPEALQRAALALQSRHDALRSRFERGVDGSWRQRVRRPGELESGLVRVVELSSVESLAAAGEAIQSSLDLEDGPIWRIGCFRVGSGWRVLIAIHHLVVDGVSWRILLEELQTAYAQAERGEAVALPAPSSSWRSWTQQLKQYAQRPERVAELAWWQRSLASAGQPSMFPMRMASGIEEPPRSRSWRLSPERTVELLREAPRAYRMRVDEVLLAVLACALGRRLKHAEVVVELEGHGREDVIEGVDLSRTVGWFTTQFPLRLPCREQPSQALPSVRERLHAIPQRGLHWGLLAYGDDLASRRALAALPAAEIGFNYLGRFDQGVTTSARFSVSHESAGEAVAAAGSTADHALDIDGLIADGCLALHWTYCPQRIDDALAADLMAAFDVAMTEMLDHLALASPCPAAAPARLPAIPLELEAKLAQDAAALTWIERARLEAGLMAPPDLAALSIVPLNALHAPRELFLLPPGHGMVGDYGALAGALNGVATVYALQAPMLHGHPETAETFEALAAAYVARILAVQPQGPHALLGWSFGGRLAVAAAAQLTQRGMPPAFVGIVDTATHWEKAGDQLDEEQEPALPAAVATALSGSMLGAALRADARHVNLMAAHMLPRIDGNLYVWRALRNRSDSRRRMDWARHTAGIVYDHPLDATHSGIVRHPAFFQAVAQRLAEN